MIWFICGCSSKVELPTTHELLRTFDGIGHDAEGFIVCHVHRMRRKGWRSVPYAATTMPVPGMGDWTELQYEQFLLFGEIPPRKKMTIHQSVPDIRFNEDPAEFYRTRAR